MAYELDTSVWLEANPCGEGWPAEARFIGENADDVVFCADTVLAAAKAVLGEDGEVQWNFGSIRALLRELSEGKVPAYSPLTPKRRATLLRAIGAYALELAEATDKAK